MDSFAVRKRPRLTVFCAVSKANTSLVLFSLNALSFLFFSLPGKSAALSILSAAVSFPLFCAEYRWTYKVRLPT